MNDDEPDAASVTFDTALGPIEVPVPIEEAIRLADEVQFGEPGFDIGFCVYGIERPLTEPTIVGVIVRVPGETDYATAVDNAANVYLALQATGAVPDLGNARLAKVMVQSYDSFNEDDE